MYCLDVYEQLKTQLWEDDAVTGLFFIKFACSIFRITESNHWSLIINVTSEKLSVLHNKLVLFLLLLLSVGFFMVFVVTGEACGLAMGLVMLGSKSATAIEEMVGVS